MERDHLEFDIEWLCIGIIIINEGRSFIMLNEEQRSTSFRSPKMERIRMKETTPHSPAPRIPTHTHTHTHSHLH